MKILEHRALRGPNYYSRYPTIHMLLDIGELEELPSDKIRGFPQRLERAMPSLREHRCSPGYRGGFLERLERGTWAGHIVEHVALELQVLAGMDVGYGKTITTKQRGIYAVAYRYRHEEAGLQAGRYAVQLVDDLIASRPVDVDAMVRHLRELREENALGPSTGSIVNEARRRGIPVMRLDDSSYIQLGYGVKQRRIQATMTSATSGIGVEIADDKRRTKEILAAAGIPVPQGEVARDADEAVEIVGRIGYPVALKPLVGNHGRGITTNVRDEQELRKAFEIASAVNPRVVVERHLEGADFRILVINHRFVAAARRDPAHVVGDGRTCVRELIARANADPRRGEGHEKALTRIPLDDITGQMLARQGLGFDSVPPDGMMVVLRPAANISAGGTSTDVTDEVHPAVRAMSERVSRIIDLDIMGIDIVAPDLRRPLDQAEGGIVEVNAAPGFRMHLEPSHGKPRNVAAPVIDMLFPDGADGRIPIVAVTGTNGKTTTVRLISHILRINGARVGMATTSGVEVQGQRLLTGDYSGPTGAETVLREPTVDHAVVEVARGGILRRGLAFEECDVGILLNVSSDHLGMGGIDTLDDLLRLKSTVIEVVRDDGAAVLNAEDPRVVSLKDRARGRRILFAVDPACPAFVEHVEDGGTGVTVEDGHIIVRHGVGKFPLAAVRDIPITLEGVATFNVQNALAAVAAAHALGVPDDCIAMALASFNPTANQLPGRMNIFDVGGFTVVVDYGHNVAALKALGEVLPHLARGRRINVASATGNRRDEDLREFGRTIARMYHHIVLCDADPRGRPTGETPDFVHDGLREGGFSDQNLQIVLDEEQAIDIALSMAGPGDLVVLQVDDVQRAIRKVRALQEARGAQQTPAAPAAQRPPPAEQAPAEAAPPRAEAGAEQNGRARV